MQDNIYDAQFRGNILSIGKTGCRKTHFVQKLVLNNFFGRIVKIEWVSSIPLSKSREAEIQSCFNSKVEFHYAQDTDDLKELIQTFKPRIENLVQDDITSSIYGENKLMDRLIAMDNISSSADRYKEFADFLTIIRKYRYHCLYAFYVFHIATSDKEIWKKIISQKNTFNIFPSSVPFLIISKLLQSNCIPTTTKYVPVCSMLINRPFLIWQIEMKEIA